MHTFQVKKGAHYEGQKVYREGQTFQSPRELHKLFKEKFILISSNQKAAEPTPAPPPSDPAGTDVTDEFEGAKEEGLKVLREGRTYNVYGEGTTQPLNEDPLNKSGVRDLISSLKGE